MKRNHAGLSDQLLRIVRALDALEGRFAEQSHHHNSKTYQIHEALSRDLSQLEAVLAPNSAGEPTRTQVHCYLVAGLSWQEFYSSAGCWFPGLVSHTSSSYACIVAAGMTMFLVQLVC